MPRKATYDPPPETAAILKCLRTALRTTKDDEGRRVGSAKCGVYLFYDYDGEPIYVGQTYENLGGRIGRHLTGQRSDAVAMSVLDVFEVADIEMWPFFHLEGLPKAEIKEVLKRAEYTVYKKAVAESEHGAILNEEVIPETDVTDLPQSFRIRIVPDEIYDDLKHPDTRIARRASTIADLARVISERKVGRGLRQTLLVQAKRLEHLAAARLDEAEEEATVQDPSAEV